ncbi:riboflavin synthase [Solilutibacter silvestris]|uniref:riboflavin synthase n=1 Tax=Solilutibacter silvestris TaxID=1645665 RepID=UPI003D338300
MFTGLIQGVGGLRGSEPRDGGLRMQIDVGSLPFADVELGESIAVNGVCLTVVQFDAESFAVDVSSETLRLTTLGNLKANAVLNLERAMRPSDRFGGHVVSGHVDGMGKVLQAGTADGEQVWRFAAPRELHRYIAKKGSICVDGVSLTVNEVDDEGFAVMLIPHTISHTAFSATRAGDAVNLEVDLIARYVERMLGAQR